jgi:hypothetical protein
VGSEIEDTAVAAISIGFATGTQEVLKFNPVACGGTSANSAHKLPSFRDR